MCAQAWVDAASRKGSELNTDEKWKVGTDLIARSGDPAAAERVHAETNNYYRLMRVLEIVLHTGRTMAEFEAKAETPAEYDFR